MTSTGFYTVVSKGIRGFPAKDLASMKVAEYVDGVNFAPNIKAKSLIGVGFVDTICPPAGIFTAFNLIKGPKLAAMMPESPHNNTATPAQQAPFVQREQAWLQALASGQPVPMD